MSIDRRIAKAIVIGSVGLGSLLINPNFEMRDFSNPNRYFQKIEYNRGYNNSGLVYGVSAGATYGAAIAGLYSLLTRRKK